MRRSAVPPHPWWWWWTETRLRVRQSQSEYSSLFTIHGHSATVTARQMLHDITTTGPFNLVNNNNNNNVVVSPCLRVCTKEYPQKPPKQRRRVQFDAEGPPLSIPPCPPPPPCRVQSGRWCADLYCSDGGRKKTE